MIYLISIKIRAPLIFAQILKEASSRSTKAQKLKGEETMLQMNEKTENLH